MVSQEEEDGKKREACESHLVADWAAAWFQVLLLLPPPQLIPDAGAIIE